MNRAPQDLVAQALAGDRRSLARAITLVENGAPGTQGLLSALFPHAGRALVIGVTGPPGAGKSSLVDRLTAHLRAQGKTVGIVAVDPTSPFSGGAILALVLAESLFIAVVGGGLGLSLAWLFVQQGDPTNGLLPVFILPPRDIAIGATLMAALGLLAGAAPAIGAMRLRITDALRRN